MAYFGCDEVETKSDKYIVVFPMQEAEPLGPLATIYPDGRIEGTSDQQLIELIRVAIEDEQTVLELTSVALNDDPVWARYFGPVLEGSASLQPLILDPPDDLVEALRRHKTVLQGPASKYDSETPEWAWLVCAALFDRRLDARQVGYGMPKGYIASLSVATRPRSP